MASTSPQHFYSPSAPEDIVESGASRVAPDSLHAVFMGQVLDVPHPGLTRAEIPDHRRAERLDETHLQG